MRRPAAGNRPGDDEQRSSMTNSGKPQNDFPPRRCAPPEEIDSMETLKGVHRERVEEVRRRLAEGFYNRTDVRREVAGRLMESGDLPADD